MKCGLWISIKSQNYLWIYFLIRLSNGISILIFPSLKFFCCMNMLMLRYIGYSLLFGFSWMNLFIWLICLVWGLRIQLRLNISICCYLLYIALDTSYNSWLCFGWDCLPLWKVENPCATKTTVETLLLETNETLVSLILHQHVFCRSIGRIYGGCVGLQSEAAKTMH